MTYDIAIVGAGIAGASLAAALAPQARVLLLEAEAQAGYHATGRSAAFWSETYGGPGIQPLTSASEAALRDGGFLQPLGSLHIGRAEDAAKVDAFLAAFAGTAVPLIRVDPAAFVPGLRPEWTLGIHEPTCAYIDVAALHAFYLSAVRRAGGTIAIRSGLEAAHRADGLWTIDTPAGRHRATMLVNAAGAWADTIAIRTGAMPIGIRPYRRTMAQIRTDPPASPTLPLVVDIAGRFYFKPDTGGTLWLSPHDETPVEPCDAAPEELDVAIAIDRFEQVVDGTVAAVDRSWAGLRSFAPDRLPVYGFDPQVPGLFWCAGQGGFGIQTAPAGAAVAASLLLGQSLPAGFGGIDPERYSPARFERR